MGKQMMCQSHGTRKASLFCQDCSAPICIEQCLTEHQGHKVLSSTTVVRESVKPWQVLLKKVQKALSKIDKASVKLGDSREQIEANLKRAEAKCQRVARAGKEGDVRLIIEAKDDLDKYTQKSITLFESRLASEQEEKQQKAAKKDPKQAKDSLASRLASLEERVSHLEVLCKKQKSKIKKMKKQLHRAEGEDNSSEE